MKALDRKLWRDLRQLWSQVLTIALVVASGVAGFLATFSAWDALSWSRETYYAEARFADVFTSLKRAPVSLLPRIAAVPGVAQLQDGVAHGVQIFIPGVQDPIHGRMTAIEPRAPQHLNQVTLREGHWPADTVASGRLEVLVSAAFAQARQLRLGDTLQALMNGKLQELVVAGIALSPEFIFAGMGGSPDVHGFGIFWMHRDAVAAAWDMRSAFNQVSLRLAPGAKEAEVIEALNSLLAPYGGINAYGREDHLSHRMLNSEIREQQVLGTVLPSIFLLVAAFLLQTVMTRHIGLQREQIAALKALGYDNRRIGWHYLRMVGVIVGLGCVLGVALGDALGQWFSLDQQPAAAGVRNQTDLAEGLHKTGVRGSHRDVAGHGNRRTGTGRHTIDGHDCGQLERLQASRGRVEFFLDHRARVGALEQAGAGGEVEFGQVQPGAKAPARACEHQGADVRRSLGAVQQGAQALVHFAGETVEGLRAVERDNGDGAALLVEHGVNGRIGHGGLLGTGM